MTGTTMTSTDQTVAQKGYAHPETLVTTEWLAQHLDDPTLRIVTVCEYGRISTLAAATLRELGFRRAAALDGGLSKWREADYPLETGVAQPWRGELSPEI